MSKLWAGWRAGQDLRGQPIPPGGPSRAVRRAGQVLAEALPHCANVVSDHLPGLSLLICRVGALTGPTHSLGWLEV